MTTRVGVRFFNRGKIEPFTTGELSVQKGDAVIVETDQGPLLGLVVTEPVKYSSQCCGGCCTAHLPQIDRLATARERDQFEENCRYEKEAFQIAKDCIDHLELPMVLVRTEYSLDRRHLVFYFTADGRVDFRELLKDLAARFRTRIELRQIGVRDEARLCGGLGICGRELCCCSFLTEFAPVSIKMAKEQDLSMNPGKISGVCGRLLCCLKYEQEAYEDAHSRLPQKGKTVQTPQGPAKVLAVDVLKELVTVRLLNDESSDPLVFKADEVQRMAGSNHHETHKEQ